jgi:predicted transcriptional regulator
MGVVSVRFNKEEEKLLKKLADYFHTDKSALIKKSLFDLYENMIDLTTIKSFETKEKKGKVSFTTADDIIND